MSRFTIFAATAAMLMALGSTAIAAPPAIVVNSTDDNLTSDEFCTLREAIRKASGLGSHAECAAPRGKIPRIDVTNPGGDTIFISDAAGVLTIFSSIQMQIIGPGPELLTIDGTSSVAGGIFVVLGDLDLSGVRLTNGSAPNHGGAIDMPNPGAILTLSD